MQAKAENTKPGGWPTLLALIAGAIRAEGCPPLSRIVWAARTAIPKAEPEKYRTVVPTLAKYARVAHPQSW